MKSSLRDGLPARGWRSQSAITGMQILLSVAVVGTLSALALPLFSSMRQKTAQQVALDKMRNLGSALSTYASQNSGALPAEDVDGTDSWHNIAKPDAKDAWYNALPRLLGRKGAGDYSPTEFYSDSNLVFLPGANYPDQKKVLAPQFAIAFNTKLHRNDGGGQKQQTKLEQIINPSRTVAFLEQGCLNESKTLEVQSRNDYDGSPKGSAKSFVGRYGGKGVLCFIDGHVELAAAKDLLTQTGTFPFPQANVIWTPNPSDNPNKDSQTASAKKKAKK